MMELVVVSKVVLTLVSVTKVLVGVGVGTSRGSVCGGKC